MLKKSRFIARIPFQALLVLLLAASLAAFPAPARAATGVVGAGTPASCSEPAFDAAFHAVQIGGGGTVTFNCGSAPAIILFSTVKLVTANTVLEGGGRITLSGNNATGLFQVFSGQALTLNNIILTRGWSPSGAVENFGTLSLNNSQVTSSASPNSGGGVLNHNILNLNNTVISGNSAGQKGGGIYTDGGAATVTNSLVTGNSAGQEAGNTAEYGGGGIAADTGALLVISGSQFIANQAIGAFAQGGALLGKDPATSIQANGLTFHQNHSSRGGALSLLSGGVVMNQSVFTGNWAAYGGAVRQEGGVLSLTDTRLSGNGYGPGGVRVTTGGGALSWGEGGGTASLSRVTISGNWASYGGGFDHASGSTTLTNVTLSGNQAVGGGGFDQGGGTLNLVNVTIAKNSAPFFGGGIGNRAGTLTLKNTLLAGNIDTDNQAPWNCNKSIGSTPFSLSSDATCGFGVGRDGVDPLIGPLKTASNFAWVHLLASASPAVDAATGTGCPLSDQRGVARPQGAACDIGAVELAPGETVLVNTTYVPILLR